MSLLCVSPSSEVLAKKFQMTHGTKFTTLLSFPVLSVSRTGTPRMFIRAPLFFCSCMYVCTSSLHSTLSLLVTALVYSPGPLPLSPPLTLPTRLTDRLYLKRLRPRKLDSTVVTQSVLFYTLSSESLLLRTFTTVVGESETTVFYMTVVTRWYTRIIFSINVKVRKPKLCRP